jgi:O-antigen/teichoic acid export membrane protein
MQQDNKSPIGIEISKKLVVINSASSIVTKVVNLSVLVWLHQYLLERISPEEYSIYPVMMAVMVFVPVLTVILTSGIGRYIVEAYAKGDERRVTQIVSTMFPILTVAGVVLLALGMVFAWYVDRVLTIPLGRVWDARIMMALMMFSAAIRLPAAVFGVGLYVRQKFVLSNCVQLCASFVRIALLFVLLLGVSTRVLWVVVASVSAEFCSLLVITGISCKLIPALRFRVNEIRWSLAKTLTAFGGWNVLMHVAETIRMASDTIILNKLGTPMDVTCFHLGSLPHRQITLFASGIKGVLTPALTAMHATDDRQKLRSSFLKIGRYSLWGSLVVSVPLIVFCKEVVLFWVGAEYLMAANIISLLLMMFPVTYGFSVLGNIAVAKAQIRGLALRAVMIQLFNLGLTLYLVGSQKMGAMGSAISTCFTMTIVWPIVHCRFAFKLTDVSATEFIGKVVIPGCVPGACSCMLWIIIRFTVAPKTVWSLTCCVLGGLVFYCLCLLCCLKHEDWCDIRKMGHVLRGRFCGVAT